jgi:hypothetical protein
MKYQLTYEEFIYEAINYEKITELKNRISNLTKRLSIESDNEKKANIQKQIKINKLRLMIAQIG